MKRILFKVVVWNRHELPVQALQCAQRENLDTLKGEGPPAPPLTGLEQAGIGMLTYVWGHAIGQDHETHIWALY